MIIISKETISQKIQEINSLISSLTFNGGSGGSSGTVTVEGKISSNDVLFTNVSLINSAKDWKPSWGGSASISVDEDKLTVTHTGQGFFRTKDLKSSRGYIRVSIKIDRWNQAGNLCLALVGKTITDTTQESFNVIQVIENGTTTLIEHDLDLNYYSAHQNLSIDEPYFIQISSYPDATDGGNIDVTFSNATVSDILGETAEQTLTQYASTVDSKLSYLEGAVDSSTAGGKVWVSDADGHKYYLAVENGTVIPKESVLPTSILYIGNSLLGGTGGGGEGSFGTCATDKDNDYYAYVNKYLDSQSSITIKKSKLVDWSFEESASENAADTVITNTITPKLTSDLDLVIIQYGDNVSAANTPVFEKSCAKLVDAIKTNCPKARIAWVGMWFSTNDKKNILTSMCKTKGVTFVDITDLNSNPEYRNGKGTTVTLNGVSHVVTSEAEYNHPSNSGFRVIADRIIAALF